MLEFIKRMFRKKIVHVDPIHTAESPGAPDPQAHDHKTCHFCKLRHPQVEAGGIWFCPNPLCPSVGSHWFRRKLRSFRMEDGYCVCDEVEWEMEGMKYIEAIDDEDLRERIKRTSTVAEIIKARKKLWR